jgi:hypothetical protein
MSSWWELGEHVGFQGSSLALYKIVCGFCHESGKFETAHHLEIAAVLTSQNIVVQHFTCRVLMQKTRSGSSAALRCTPRSANNRRRRSC